MISPAQAVRHMIDSCCPANSGYQAPRSLVSIDDAPFDARKMKAQKARPTPCAVGQSLGVSRDFIAEVMKVARRNGPSTVRDLCILLHPSRIYDENRRSSVERATRSLVQSGKLRRKHTHVKGERPRWVYSVAEAS